MAATPVGLRRKLPCPKPPRTLEAEEVGRPKPLGRGRFGLLAGTGARLETIGAAREAPNSSALGTGDLVPHCELFASDN